MTKKESSLITKRKFIEEAEKIIHESGIENIRVRDLAKRVGVTTGALYKHFDDVDYLIVLASLRELDQYVNDLNNIHKTGLNDIEKDIAAWKSFINYAFQNPPVYLNLFWGKYNDMLDQALQDYFSIYPLESPNRAIAMSCVPIYTGNLEARDYIWMRRAANEGYIRYEDAAYLSRTCTLLVKGMLQENVNTYRNKELTQNRILECQKIVEKNIRDHMIK